MSDAELARRCDAIRDRDAVLAGSAMPDDVFYRLLGDMAKLVGRPSCRRCACGEPTWQGRTYCSRPCKLRYGYGRAAA